MIWRITERRAFHQLSRADRKARTTSLWCRYVNDPAAVPLRVGYAIGRAVGPATQRNRVRRRLRAIIARDAPNHGLDHGLLLVGARPGVTEHSFETLERQMGTLLGRVGAS